MLGIQLFKNINMYQEKGLVHNSLTLESIQMGVGKNNNKLYFNDLIDSKPYLKKNSLAHI